MNHPTGFPHLLIFPEGTTTNGQQLLEFQRGAFATGKPVQPMLLRYPFKHLDPSFVDDGPSMLCLIVRMVCQVYNQVRVYAHIR